MERTFSQIDVFMVLVLTSAIYVEILCICLDINNRINPEKDGSFARDLLQFVGLNENERLFGRLEDFRKSQSKKLNKISTYAHRPIQRITLTEFCKQNGLMDTPGAGWNDINKEDFFQRREWQTQKESQS